MATKKASSFNTASFLARPGKGRTVTKYRKNQVVFSQGDPADAVYLSAEGKTEGHGGFGAGQGSCRFNSRVRMNFSGKPAWRARQSGW